MQCPDPLSACFWRWRLVALLSLAGWALHLGGPSAYGASNAMLYDPVISAVARNNGLEPALVKAVIQCESGFNPWAQSPRGAQGLMQLMPTTQTMLGVSQPFDPQHNIAGGTRYLAMLKQMFRGNLSLALAAYNAGPQTVITAGYAIPAIAETQQYVRCVSAAYETYSRDGGLVAPGLAPPLAPRFAPLPVPRSPDTRQALVVRDLKMSSAVARLGERLTVQVEAINTSTRPSHGIVMLNYPEQLVSFMALHTTGQETMVQLPGAAGSPPGQAVPAATSYQLLWSHWPTWKPGERRTAVIALVPRLPQDITMHLSVVLDDTLARAVPQRWSSVVRIPFRSAIVAQQGVRYTTSPR